MKAFIFDMDGLLVDSETLSAKSWKISAEKHGLPDMEKLFPNLMGSNTTTRMSLLKEAYGDEIDFFVFEEEVKSRVRAWEKEAPIPLLPGVQELLTYLKEEGYMIALASSSRKETILNRMNYHGLDRFFSYIISGEDIKISKPNPEIFILCAARLGVPAEECIVLEDSPNGVRAAHAAGMRAVMIPNMCPPTDELRALAYKIYPSLNDVKKALVEKTF